MIVNHNQEIIQIGNIFINLFFRLNEAAWDNITELDKYPAFNGIVASIEQNERDWKNWYMTG